MPLNENEEARPATRSPFTWASELRISSARPSAKYSSSRCGLMSRKGRTAMEAGGGAGNSHPGRLASSSPSRSPSASEAAAMVAISGVRRRLFLAGGPPDGCGEAPCSARRAARTVRTWAASLGRRTGSFSSIRAMSSASAGTAGTSMAGAFREETSALGRSEGNGSSSASMRYRITPSANTSVRSSSGAPRHCSGAM